MRVRGILGYEISRALIRCRSAEKRLLARYDRLNVKISSLNEQIRRTCEQNDEIKARKKLLLTVAFVFDCVTPDMMARRNEIRRLRTRIERKKMTTTEYRRLSEQADRAERELKRVCPHPLVIRNDGNRGSGECGDDSAFHGSQACVICGLVAADDDGAGNNSTFPNDGKRLRNLLHLACADRAEASVATLQENLADYLKLTTREEIVEKFLGSERLARLEQCLMD